MTMLAIRTILMPGFPKVCGCGINHPDSKRTRRAKLQGIQDRKM
jgi:hypothetical protein